jgi:hypothetical protein
MEKDPYGFTRAYLFGTPRLFSQARSGLPSLELLRELIPQAGYNRRTFETQPVRMPTYSGLQQ